jgi:predicted NUDIX family NTP pyrophosphohydrolase
LRALGKIRQRGGKRVIAFCEIDCRIAALPEVDRAAWFDLGTARSKILSAQTELLDRLEKGVP